MGKDTPKPHLALVPKPRPRRDETVSFETEGPPTDRMEIPISVPVSDDNLLFYLPQARYGKGQLIVSEQDHARRYLVIEAGRAVEYALTSRGEATADERLLNPTDIIGLTQCVRVVAHTDLIVRVIDFQNLEAGYDRSVERFANRLIREAAINAGSMNRDRLIRTSEENAALRQALDDFDRLKDQLLVAKTQNAEHRSNGRLLSREIMRQREVITHLELTLSHRIAELESALSITGMYKDDYLDLAKAIASYGHLFEDMQNSEDPLVATTGFKLLSFLHTLRITTGLSF